MPGVAADAADASMLNRDHEQHLTVSPPRQSLDEDEERQIVGLKAEKTCFQQGLELRQLLPLQCRDLGNWCCSHPLLLSHSASRGTQLDLCIPSLTNNLQVADITTRKGMAVEVEEKRVKLKSANKRRHLQFNCKFDSSAFHAFESTQEYRRT